MSLKYFNRDAPTDDVVSALRKDGACVVLNQVDTVVADAIRAELREQWDKQGRCDESDFNGYSTLRASGVLRWSKTSAPAVRLRLPYRERGCKRAWLQLSVQCSKDTPTKGL